MTIADNGGGIGFVFGEEIQDWQSVDFQHHLIDLRVDDQPSADNFLGEMRCIPIEALADLINHLGERGISLNAENFISTGAATVPQPFSKGSKVSAEFGVLGRIELQFS